MSLIRGVLLAGQFRTQHELNTMSADDQRNTLIVEMAGHSNQPVPHFQSLNDFDLAGAGAAMVFLLKGGIRDATQLKTMSDDDQRNTAIVEIDAQTHLGGPQLQGLSNIDLVLLGLGQNLPGSLAPSSFISGVLLAGGFRTQHQLVAMSADDQRNTLIVEMAGHSNQPVPHFQSLNDFDLAGAGAAMVFLLKGGIRDATQLKTMSDDDQRNTAIVEIDAQTHLGSPRLQGLRTIDVVATALGVDPVFPVIRPRRHVFKVDSVEIIKKKSDDDHNDSDWLSIVVTVGNPITKDVQTLPAKLHHIGGNIPSGIIILPGTDVAASGGDDFVSDVFTAGDSDVVVVTYLLTNLGSSDAEEQFAQAVKVTDKVVQIVGPIAGAAIGLFFGTPGEGFKIGQQIAKGIDTAISALGDVFDFLGIHIGPPNCNGEVLHDTLTFQAGELAQAVNHPASREYTGPTKSDRCGGPPQSKVNFSVVRDVPKGGLFPTDA